MTETLGNLGDFIGGFGVIITVIYLAYQIKQKSAYSTEFQAFIDEPPSGSGRTSQFASDSQVDSA